MVILETNSSHEEINFLRLLSRTENMAKEKRGSFDWRLEKYVETLSGSLKQLKKMNVNQPSHFNLIDYTKRVDLLCGLLQSDKMSSTSLKTLALNQLAPSKNFNEENEGIDKTKSKVVKRFAKASAGQQLLMETRARLDGQLRKELLGPTRRRKQNEELDVEKEVQVMEQEREQLRLADEMAILARSLKDNAALAGRIVREDNERLIQSTTKTDENLSKLKKESEKLEQYVKNACTCWVWFMLLAVIITFLWMIIFIKMFPKR